jgi:hypothetical protein
MLPQVLIGCNQSELFGGSHVRNVYMAALKENLEMNPNFRAANNALWCVGNVAVRQAVQRCPEAFETIHPQRNNGQSDNGIFTRLVHFVWGGTV